MDVETVKAKILEQVDKCRSSAMARAYGWTFELQGQTLCVAMNDRFRPKRRYLLLVDFDDFPRRAPSYVFVDPMTKARSLEAWPANVRHNDNDLIGICTPGTREFHEKYHLNDKQHIWDAERYTVLDTLQRIHALMEKGGA